jgi:phosphoribosylaminoimidazole-succinocarboxamide synthase
VVDNVTRDLTRFKLLTFMALINSELPDLTLLSKGKVRDVYVTSDPELLLFVASDRISAYDVIMRNVCFSTYLLATVNERLFRESRARAEF